MGLPTEFSNEVADDVADNVANDVANAGIGARVKCERPSGPLYEK
jgi:hypothetical protein